MKLIILFCSTFMQHLFISWCQDIELDPEVKKDFLKFAEAFNKKYMNMSVLKFNNTITDTNEKIDKEPAKEKKILIQPNNLFENKVHRYADFKNFILFDLKAHISNEACLKLKSLLNTITNNLSPTFDIDVVFQKVIKDYVSELNKYFNFVKGQQIIHEAEKIFYMSYLTETANQLFSSEANRLLNKIIDQDGDVPDIDVKTLKEEVQNTIIVEKRDNLQYICQEIDICRVSPSYSDRVAELLSVILKLPLMRFETIVKILQDIVGVKAAYFNTIIDEDVAFQIGSKFKTLLNTSEISKFFSDLRDVITQRYKILKSKDEEVNKKIKAMRILLDIIDKTFENIGEDFIVIEFDNLIKRIELFAIGESTDQSVEIVLADFCNGIVDVLKCYWDSDAKDEVNVLIEIIMTGTSENNMLSDDLYNKGSKFVGEREMLGLFI